MKMRALSLWQPWASAIAVGVKSIETRSWTSSYRGLVAIHASMRASKDVRTSFNSLLHPGQGEAEDRAKFADAGITHFEHLPLGAIVATAELSMIQRTEHLVGGITEQEYRWGNYGPQRFGWVFKNIVPLEKPIPFVGRQGLWNIEVAV